MSKDPVAYASIPCVAAFVGISTNWMGVQMLFYPIEYKGTEWHRQTETPYGLFGWQGVVPCKTKRMASRLVSIVTDRLLSLEEAFARLDSNKLAKLLQPVILEQVSKDSGSAWSAALAPGLPLLLPRIVRNLQRDVAQVLNLHNVVLSAFMRDKTQLVDLFQKVGRVELEFLVNSGFGFGMMLGVAQMLTWAAYPVAWTLPAAGALVGYVTNWLAIYLLFSPAEPVYLFNDQLVIQGLFESRQPEVSDEFAAFMASRVLDSTTLLKDLSSGGKEGDLYAFLRKQIPPPIPEHVIHSAVKAIANVANHPDQYPEIHAYVTRELSIEHTLSSRLKRLSPIDFEDLLHPVFQEDEIILICTGGVLGLVAGGLQTRLGWEGPGATQRSVMTILITLLSSLGFYGYQKYEAMNDEPLVSKDRPHLRRRMTIVRTKGDE